MNRIINIGLAIAAVPVALAATGANAATVFDTPTSTLGNQVFTGGVGLDFAVNSPVVITALGAFDAGAKQFNTDVMVGIYNLTTSSFVSPLVNFNGHTAASGNAYAFQSVQPFTLVSGNNYSVYAYGFSDNNLIYNSGFADPKNSSIVFDNLGGALTNGFGRYGGMDPKNDLTVGYSSEFGAGSFVATAVTAVPEPATWAMMLMGFGMIGVGVRSRRKPTVQLTYG